MGSPSPSSTIRNHIYIELESAQTLGGLLFKSCKNFIRSVLICSLKKILLKSSCRKGKSRTMSEIVVHIVLIKKWLNYRDKHVFICVKLITSAWISNLFRLYPQRERERIRWIQMKKGHTIRKAKEVQLARSRNKKERKSQNQLRTITNGKGKRGKALKLEN